MEKKYDIIVIGEICQDLLVSGLRPDVMDLPMQKVESMQFALGGDGANESSVLAKLGDHIAFLGRIGTDSRGEMLMQYLHGAGVDTSLVVRREDCRNLGCIVAMKTDGTHTFLVEMGRDFQLTLEDIDLEAVRSARAVCAGSLYDVGELEVKGLDLVFDEARRAGALTFADTNNDLHGRGPRAFDYLYPYIDYLVPSYEEGVYITGEQDPEKMAAFFLEKGAGHVLVKMGAKGSFFMDRSESFYTPAFDVVPVNTTGCGDNFIAGFMHSILKGWSHREAALFANGTGGLNSQGIGASLYVRSEAHVLEFMKTHRQKNSPQ